MKQLLDLLKYPYSVETKLSVSDKMLTGLLKSYAKHALLKDILCKVRKDVMEIQLTVGLAILTKNFTIELEIEDIIFDENRFLLTLKVNNKSIAAISSILKMVGKASISIARFEKDRLYIDLTQHKKSFLAKQPLALRNELKKFRISKPILVPNNMLVTITKG